MVTEDSAPQPAPEEKPIEEQAREQTGQRQVRLRLDERNMQTMYSNGFRTLSLGDELSLDFGLNIPAQVPQGEQPEILFQVNQRVIMNFYTAKRLALTLGQLIRQHESRFGELELDMAKRLKQPPDQG